MEQTDSGHSNTFAVLNPCGIEKDVPPVPLAPRITDLNNKTIYCVSQFVGGADGFLQKISGPSAALCAGRKDGIQAQRKHLHVRRPTIVG